MRPRVLAPFLLVLATVLAGAFWHVRSRVEHNLRELLIEELEQKQGVFDQFRRFTSKQIQDKSAVAAGQIRLRAILSTPGIGPRDLASVVGSLMQRLGGATFLVFSRDGTLLYTARPFDRAGWRAPRAVSEALAGRSSTEATELWGALQLVACSPVIDHSGEAPVVVGAVMVSEDLGLLAGEFRRIAGREIHLALRGRQAAFTTTSGAEQELRAALDQRSAQIEDVIAGRQPRAVLSLTLGGERYLGLAIPIPRGGPPGAIGSLTILQPLDRLLRRQLGRIELGLLLTGLVVMALLLLLNGWFARTVARLERRAAQAARDVERAALEASRQRAIAEMVVGVAHEINTPLGIVNTGASLLAETIAAGAPDAETLEDLRQTAGLMQKNIARANRLIQTFKQVSVDQVSEARQEVELGRLVAETVELFEVSARRSGITVVVQDRIGEGRREWSGFPGYLSQTLLALLANVERYAYAAGSGGRVEIVLARDDSARPPAFSVTVRDFGRGIEPASLDRIFDAFYTTGRAAGGTGLGLAIARNLVVDGLHGRIEAHSEVGAGATFTITFPQQVPPGEAGR